MTLPKDSESTFTIRNVMTKKVVSNRAAHDVRTRTYVRVHTYNNVCMCTRPARRGRLCDVIMTLSQVFAIAAVGWFVWRQSRLGRTAKPETESSGIFMTAYPSKQNYYQIAREVSAPLSVCALLLFVCASELFIERFVPLRCRFPLVPA